ncbi:MAG: DUF3800 domain-containing protein [Acaryochloris sp. RU_4_1]|nr:DUF3800 domain-containing protein [Acaryochloris sp. SU_5_25]NJM68029.1 DUF3800 domain-containing protein [Acaryochloris sp. RU_4_1]NJN39077.1 DUF3800 domain-containing protein [Acaryochloridaceae cyanobacterium CSU_3_4]NJR56728.1 DUF3800 domain-containing protein [Acaryochloris sp. CRU_2_0]
MNIAQPQRKFQPKQGEFTLFIDESGSPKPNPKDRAKYFALGGVLLEREDETFIASEVSAFKQRWSSLLDSIIFPHITTNGM